jgi:hypothetical protein
VKIIQERMKKAQVFLKVAAWRNTIHFGIKGKLTPMCILVLSRLLKELDWLVIDCPIFTPSKDTIMYSMCHYFEK